jgi:hypothetical protein
MSFRSQGLGIWGDNIALVSNAAPFPHKPQIQGRSDHNFLINSLAAVTASGALLFVQNPVVSLNRLAWLQIH